MWPYRKQQRRSPQRNEGDRGLRSRLTSERTRRKQRVRIRVQPWIKKSVRTQDEAEEIHVPKHSQTDWASKNGRAAFKRCRTQRYNDPASLSDSHPDPRIHSKSIHGYSKVHGYPFMIFGCQSSIIHASVDIHIDIQARISMQGHPIIDIRGI